MPSAGIGPAYLDPQSSALPLSYKGNKKPYNFFWVVGFSKESFGVLPYNSSPLLGACSLCAPGRTCVITTDWVVVIDIELFGFTSIICFSFHEEVYGIIHRKSSKSCKNFKKRVFLLKSRKNNGGNNVKISKISDRHMQREKNGGRRRDHVWLFRIQAKVLQIQGLL